MSTHAQVHMVNSGVYLYQHWDGRDLPQKIQKVMGEYRNWDNEDSLTKMFSAAMEGDLDTGTKPDPYAIVTHVNVQEQTVEIFGLYYSFDRFCGIDLSLFEEAY